MATSDIRFNRMNDEYQSVRNAQDELFDKVDSFEVALLGLTEAVAENREEIMENREQIAEVNRKLDALIEHLDVPYKPPIGFTKE